MTYTQGIKSMDTLRPRLRTALDYISAYTKEHGYSPSLKDIAIELTGDARNFGNISNTVIAPLIAAGYLKRGAKGQPRTLQVIAMPTSEGEAVK